MVVACFNWLCAHLSVPNIYLFWHLASLCELHFRDETPVPGWEFSWSAACNSINLFLLHAVSGAFYQGGGGWTEEERWLGMERCIAASSVITSSYISTLHLQSCNPKHQQNYSILERGRTAIMKHTEFPEWYLYSECKWRRDILTIWDWDEDKISGVRKNTAAGAYQLSLLQCGTSAGEWERGPAVNSDALRPAHCTAQLIPLSWAPAPDQLTREHTVLLHAVCS